MRSWQGLNESGMGLVINAERASLKVTLSAILVLRRIKQSARNKIKKKGEGIDLFCCMTIYHTV